MGWCLYDNGLRHERVKRTFVLLFFIIWINEALRGSAEIPTDGIKLFDKDALNQ